MMPWDFWVRAALLGVHPVVGLVYIFAVRGRSPRVVLPAMLALVLLIFSTGAEATLPFWKWRVSTSDPDAQAARTAFLIAGWIHALTYAAGLSLLIWSVAADRRDTPCRTDDRPAQ